MLIRNGENWNLR